MPQIDLENDPKKRRGLIVGIAVVIGLLQLILIFLFAWPSSRANPHDVPLALNAPPGISEAIQGGIAQAEPGAFTITTVSDDAAAQAAVLNRSAVGAISITPTGAKVYTATGDSPVLASALATGIPEALKAAAPQLPVTVVDLTPPLPADPNGQVPGSALIPLLITSLVAGALIGFVLKTLAERVAALVAYGVVAGLLSTLMMQTILGGLGGSWIANAGVLGLITLSIAAVTAGFAVVAKGPGIGLVVLVVFFFGLPFSGALSAPQLVPTPWGEIAGWLPAAAGNEALRSVAFFSGSAAGSQLLILIGWLVVGLILLAVSSRKNTQVAAQ